MKYFPLPYILNDCTFIWRGSVWSTCMMRVEQVDESRPLLSPAGCALPYRCSSFLSLWEHRVAPLKPHLRQEEIDAKGPHQEAQAEGPSGGGVLHGDTVSNTMISRLQHVYIGTAHVRNRTMQMCEDFSLRDDQGQCDLSQMHNSAHSIYVIMGDFRKMSVITTMMIFFFGGGVYLECIFRKSNTFHSKCVMFMH